MNSQNLEIANNNRKPLQSNNLTYLEKPNEFKNMPNIHIADYGDQSMVNPQPLQREESDILMEEYLCPQRLLQITKCDNLQLVKKLELVVDTTENSLGNFSSYLPNLQELSLSNSCLTSIRDIGTSFQMLNVLWLKRCNLLNFDGITSFANISELYVAYNNISDLSDISMLEKLRILDLEGNYVDDLIQIEYLSFCSALEEITLFQNPVCQKPNPDSPLDPEYNYRLSVKKILPTLISLDDRPISDVEILIENIDDDLELVTESIKSSSIEETVGDDELFRRPATGYQRPTTAARRPKTAASSLFGNDFQFGKRPVSAQSIEIEGLESRPDSGIDQCGYSDLTTGTVLCGNPINALRIRKKNNNNKLTNSIEKRVEYENTEKIERKIESVLEELKSWRSTFENQERKADILVINHDVDSCEAPSVRPKVKASTFRLKRFGIIENNRTFEEFENQSETDSGLSSSRGTDISSESHGPLRSLPIPKLKTKIVPPHRSCRPKTSSASFHLNKCK